MRMTHRSGAVSAFGILIFVMIMLFLLMAGNMVYISASSNCIDQKILECALDLLTSDEATEPAANTVTATGVIAGTYGKAERSVTVALTFPLEGGDVIGTFSGDCDGNIRGTFDSGTISGQARGSCALFIPASGTFSGTVNQAAKTVSVAGEGSAAGFSGKGSLTLTW